MCVHFQSWNRCSSCLLTFNRHCNRVPCWNGSVSRWRIHHHGLSCRSGWYERAPDEIYTNRCCEACSLEAAANRATDEKSGTMEASDETTVLRLRMTGKRVGRLVATTTRRAANMKNMFLRWWAWREALCGRKSSVCKYKRGEKRHARARIWMLGY